MAEQQTLATENSHVDFDDLSKTSAAPIDPHTITSLHHEDGGPKLSSLSTSTQALHADDPLSVVSDIAPPVHVSTTFRYPRDPELLRPLPERPGLALDFKEYIYSRESTHSTSRLEAVMTTLLGYPCISYSSGLASIHAALTYLNPKTIAIGDGYHGSHGVVGLHKRLSGCKVLPLDCKAEDLEKGDVIWLETPVNPTGTAFNIQHYADVAHSRGAYLVVDSTFAPPPLQDAFKHGADIVMHSGTKYLGGHSDMLCGILSIKNKDWLAPMLEDRIYLGSVMGSLEGWLGLRSVRTLQLRVQRQSETARRLVEALDGALTGHTVGTGLSQSDADVIKAVVKEVKHASLQTSDYKTWLRKQMPNGFGPVFAILMKTGDLAKKLPSKLHIFQHATSLGGVESLIEWRTMSDGTCPKELLRVSIGLEDERDLLDDLLQGFRLLTGQ